MTKLSNHVIVKCKLINQLVLTTEFSEIHCPWKNAYWICL